MQTQASTAEHSTLDARVERGGDACRGNADCLLLHDLQIAAKQISVDVVDREGGVRSANFCCVERGGDARLLLHDLRC